jgi:hypothetical protein
VGHRDGCVDGLHPDSALSYDFENNIIFSINLRLISRVYNYTSD